jgi:hypothetical protein
MTERDRRRRQGLPSAKTKKQSATLGQSVDVAELTKELLEQNPTLREQARAAGLRVDDLTARVIQYIDTVPSVPPFDEESRLVALSRERATLDSHLSNPTPFFDYLRSLSIMPVISVVVGWLTATIGLLSAVFATGVMSGLEFVNISPFSLSGTAIAMIVFFVLLTPFIFLFVLFRYQQFRRNQFLRSSVDRLRAETERLELLRGSAIRDRMILPAIVSVINAARSVRYDSSLDQTTFVGLSQTLDADSELSTEDQRRILHTLAHMPGGSIGVAGPRGVGKTTLLRSLCNSSRSFSDNKRTAAVLVSAPVTYDSRDFILFLFTALCRSVLVDFPGTFQGDLPEWHWAGRTRIGIGELLPVRIGSKNSMTLFLIGLAVAVSSLTATRLGQEWGWVGDPLLAVGVTPERCFWIGLGVIVVGLLGIAKERNAVRDERRVEIAGDEGARSVAATNRSGDLFDRIANEQNLGSLASSLLHELQFQQSYSFGWSGGLRLPLGPIGLESGQSRSTGLAKSQLSFPDIIHAFRLFARKIVESYVVVIGVDELDKVESPESAQRLLNDLKLLFDIEGCFYLLSVSESALASFDSRGIPVRDVMDSTFDTVIRVDYLSVAESVELLNRRVVGLPVPFAALCHCLSGGLPRDLIRVCRSIAEERSRGACDLANIAKQILEDDIAARSRALIYAIEQAGLTAELMSTIQAIRALQIGRDAKRDRQRELGRELLVAARVVVFDASALRSVDDVDTRRDAGANDMADRCDQFAAYLYHMATLADLFLHPREDHEWTVAVSEGAIGQLAKARQMIAAASTSTIAMTNEVRSMLRWDIPHMPRAFGKRVFVDR